MGWLMLMLGLAMLLATMLAMLVTTPRLATRDWYLGRLARFSSCTTTTHTSSATFSHNTL